VVTGVLLKCSYGSCAERLSKNSFECAWKEPTSLGTERELRELLMRVVSDLLDGNLCRRC
jgi:hypothetical protein